MYANFIDFVWYVGDDDDDVDSYDDIDVFWDKNCSESMQSYVLVFTETIDHFWWAEDILMWIKFSDRCINLALCIAVLTLTSTSLTCLQV